MKKNRSVKVTRPPIAKISSLASTLSVSEHQLLHMAQNIDSYYKRGKVLKKKNGDPRITHDATAPLKKVHEKIKNRLLKPVAYPYYIQGGIADSTNPRSCKSHAAFHAKKKILIAEDIADFYPNTTSELVRRVWQYCFCFSPDVAELLTRLTTYNGELPQGWKTSGYLANLAFWDSEWKLVKALEARGYSYSRFMDDVTVSSNIRINKQEKSDIISRIYGMLFQKGYKPKRSKHEIMLRGRGSPMLVTSLSVSGNKPAVPKKEKRAVRTAVYHLEQRAAKERETQQYCSEWRSVSGRVGRVQSLHIAVGTKLRERLNVIKPPKHLLSPLKQKN